MTSREDAVVMLKLIQSPDSSPGRATMTIPEAANLLGLSESATYEAAARGEIPAVKVGRRVLVIRDLLMALLSGQSSTA